MAQIPMVGDLAEVIGSYAEKVENRSLLLDKFVFHKKWPEEVDDRGREIKWDEASRWSFIRIADGAESILAKESHEKRRKAEGWNVEEQNQIRFRQEAQIAETLSRVSWDRPELVSLRIRHTQRFIQLFREAYQQLASIVIGQLEGRLAINLSDSLIQNAGICLDRQFGMPYIPGSAVKGVSRHAALEELFSSSGEARTKLFQIFRDVFGTADNDFKEGGELASFRNLVHKEEMDFRGGISFLPAYPLSEAKVVVDLTTAHYPDYYQSGREADLSKENPRPNPFPVVESGAQFAFCLVGNRPELPMETLEQARSWLEDALTRRGIGAKTAAGYGWFSLRPEVLEGIDAEIQKRAEAEKIQKQEEAARQAKIAEEAKRVAAMPPEEAACERFAGFSPEAFAKQISEMDALAADEQKGLVLALLTPQKKDTWKSWKKSDKPANKARVEKLLAASKQFGLPLP